MTQCESCKCADPESPLAAPAVMRSGMIALVVDAPNSAAAYGRTVFDGPSGEVLAATIRGVIKATGRQPDPNLLEEVAVIYAVARPQPGGKPPKIASVRACRDRLMAELAAAAPRMVISVGPAACSSLSGTGKLTPITAWRGQMRWLDVHGVQVPWIATISPGSVFGKTDFYRDLAADLWKGFTQGEPLPEPDVDVVVPRTLAEVRDAFSLFDGATVVSCDIETTGLRPWVDELLSVGYGAVAADQSGVAVIVPRELLSDPAVQDACWEMTYSRTRTTVLQNGKFDLAFMSRWFDAPIPAEAKIADTLLLGYLLDERPRKDRMGSLGLKEQASYRYDKQDYHWSWDAFYDDMRHDGTYPPGSPDRRVRTCDPERCKHDHATGYNVIAASEGRDPWVPLGSDVADMEGLYKYQGLDVYFTARMWFDLVDEADAESPRLLAAHDQVLIPAARALSACELAGAPLDLAWLASYASWLRRRISRRELVLAAAAHALGAPDDFAHGSPAQVADLMYDGWRMTPDVRKKFKKAGGPDRSTDKEHIDAAILKYLKSGTPEQRRGARWLRTLLRWRTESKQLSTYSETLVAQADRGGRVHAGFLIHGTSTGRLSSAGPNLQNIPAVDDKAKVGGRTQYTLRHGAKTYWPARRAFAPGPGRVIAEADFKTLELRVAAALSGDEKLKQAFVEDRDIHREVAASMFSKKPEEITKPERYLAKAVDFGILFGRTPKALAEGAEMDFYEREMGGKRWDEQTAAAFLNKFMRSYPQLGAWLKKNADDAVTSHYVESPFGRRRRFPFTPRTRYERLAIERQANNAPIQGSASDVCVTALARIAPRLPEGALALFPVHDSIVLEMPEELIPQVEAVCREEMETDFLGVPLTIDFEVGTSWADVG